MAVALGTSFSFASTPALVALLVGAIVFVAIGALTHEHERPFSSAMIYLVVGLAAAGVIDVLALPWFDLLQDPHMLQRFAELTLVFALFATGLRIARITPTRSWTVLLLLGVVMTATVAAVAAFAGLVMGLSLSAAIILGGILAPTDPVLAGGLGALPPLEAEDEQRDAPVCLSMESGVNDGIAAPFILLGVFLAHRDGAGWLSQWVLADVLYGIGIAVVIGAIGGYGIAALTSWLRERGLVARELDGWVAIGAAFVIFGAAQAAGSYGFIAAFVGGVAFRRFERGRYTRRVHDAADVARNFAELGTILLFASMVNFSGLAQPGVTGWLLVPVLLFVIRPLAVLLALTGVRLPLRDRLFLAWFGVKGVASLYYVGVIIVMGILSPAETATVTWTAVAVVAASIVIHGATASWLRTKLLTPS
ncbi:cation:proton antiporter domain-containing protein [Haloactinomyces albus]|uniref:NhaP-type Na+/H+ or K+/H+ antiporter n=1 Tax=Haloactinomyces albus TaxID=1352928 RepID=A0AAE3ZIC1_9ACTN|nr:cation:proton antiporter [Haloactinomyces albus]MDR7304190.1 NhaP-type Na+/H+ or K+/H+ antiporter [Haloactinomyces albus]